jgi:hypothetical protein
MQVTLDPSYDHRDTGIVLGHSTYLHRGQGTLIQNHIVVDQTVEILQAACPHLGPEQLESVRALLAKKLPAATPDIAPGLVPNVMTGRIANRLNLRAPTTWWMRPARPRCWRSMRPWTNCAWGAAS